MFRLTPEVIEYLDEACRYTGHTRNSLLTWWLIAYHNELMMIGDHLTWAKWKQEEKNQVCRTSRVVSRQEAKLVLHEEGYTTSKYEG